MIFSLKKITISLVISCCLLFAFSSQTSASTDQCPSNLNDRQCLDFLRKQSEALKKESQQLSRNLTNEQYKQLSLQEQINYMARKILESETEIKKTEIELEAKNVEIRMLEREIEDTQNKIASVKQEANKLEDSISKRLASSYKYSFMNTLELVVKSQDVDILLRKMRYLVDTRRSDKEMLTQMQSKSTVLDVEEKVLGRSKLDLEKIRIEVENKKTELFEQKENLAAQQTEHTRLLAVSKQKEQGYESELEKARETQKAIDSKISQLLAKMWAEGKLKDGFVGRIEKGLPIGTMGNTGCSTGAHLHFSINSGTQYPYWGYWWGDINPWNGFLRKGPDWTRVHPLGFIYYHVYSGTMQVPLEGRVELTQEHHQGMAIDLVSHYGASVLAAMSGDLTRGVEPVCGGKYALIEHDNGWITIYLHLQ